MPRLLVLAAILVFLAASSGCAAIDGRGTRHSVSLPPPRAGSIPEMAPPPAGTPEASRRFEIVSAALTRAFGRPRTIGAEVVLPEGFRSDEDLAVVYHVPDLGQDPAQVAERFTTHGGLPRLVLVVLDPRGIYGHHAFTDSVNEGPHGEALVTDLIPVLEQHLFAGASARRRFVTGEGLGGWSAIHLQLEYCHAFDAAYAFDPDPLDLRSFYGFDLTTELGPEPRGTVDARREESLRRELLSGRIASLESALGARGEDGRPVPLFRSGGRLDLDVVAAFARRDPAAHVRQRGSALAPRLDGKIHAIAHAGDALGRDRSLRSFESALKEAGITCSVRTPVAFELDAALVATWASMVASATP